MSTVMHLPKLGNGQWLIDFNGTKITVPIESLAWDGDSFRGDVALRFGRFGGQVVMKGVVKADGTVEGTLTSDGETPFLIPRFEGERFIRQ
jgi:hypothetical protein